MRFSAVAVMGLMVAAGVARAQQKAPEAQTPTDKQTPAEQQQKAMVILQGTVSVVPGSVCPGALRASQQATGGEIMVWTKSPGDYETFPGTRAQGLGVHVEFEHAGSRVKSVELRVSYLPLKLRSMPVDAMTATPVTMPEMEREKTFVLDRVAGTRVGGDLLVGPAATITRVRLVSVTYEDGSTWHEPVNGACAVVPSRIMLVAGK